MRILITGGCGFLGSHLVEHFLKATSWNDIVVIDKLSVASHGFDRLRDIADHWPDGGGDEVRRRVKVLGGVDLSRPVADGVLQEIGPIDYVIHAAAESHVDNSIVDPLPFLESNVIGTHHLLMAVRTLMERYRVRDGAGEYAALKRVFMVSTDEVYGPAPWPAAGCGDAEGCRFTDGVGNRVYLNCQRGCGATDPMELRGFGEDASFRPANPYAAAKAGGESVAMAYANTYKVPITIVNTMNLIGERQHAEKFVPLVIRKVLNGETVTIHADPTCTRSGTRFYLHCRTFANALGWLMDFDHHHARKPTDGTNTGGYMPIKVHVCGEREISNLEFAQMIAKAVRDFGVAVQREGLDGRVYTDLVHDLKYDLVDFHSSRPGHDLRYAMDDSMIRSMGWVRPMGLEQSLEKTVRWYLMNPQWLELKKG